MSASREVRSRRARASRLRLVERNYRLCPACGRWSCVCADRRARERSRETSGG